MGAVQLPGDSKHIRNKGASLARMLLRQDKRELGSSPQAAGPGQGLPKEQLRQIAQVVVDDFRRNQASPDRGLRLPPFKLPQPTEQRENLGLPAYSMLGYGNAGFSPLRTKALSM